RLKYYRRHNGHGPIARSDSIPSSSRPNTAPGKMQRPVRLKPIHSNSTTASVRHSSPYRLLQSSHDNHLPFNFDCMERSHNHRASASHGISPYCLPVINNFVTPVPPAMKRKERGLKGTASSTVRGRRLRPTTASSGADVINNTPKTSVHQSRVCVNMVYFGKTVRLSSDMTDTRDDVKVFQQHCGGENLCVYKGKLHEGETFQFISRRHRGFPFSLTFFLNGLQVERLSSCCEFKHRKGSRLGGKHGHFGFTGVEGASPCYKCIIAMGLDKKPTPPPKRIKEDTRREESVNSPKDEGEMETARTGEDAGSHLEGGTSEPQNMETPVKEGRALAEQKGRDGTKPGASEHKLKICEALHPSKEENVTQDDKTTEPLEETPAETADAEAAEEGKEKSAEETDVQHDETGQGAKSSEEDESSEPDKKTDETAAPDNAEAARETIEIKAESSKEQEALSYEEAPVSDAEKEEQADSEDRAAGSETEVNAENSSSSPSGSGETTVEKTADTGEENAIEESKDDIKEEQILEDESDEQCELREERRTGASEETGEEEDKEETEEEEKQTHVTSDEGEDEKTEKRNDDENVKNDEEGNEESKEDEGTENTAESAENGFKTKEDEEEAVKLLSEEDKVADDEKVEEKTENDENKLEESEVGDKSDNESKPAVQENDDEAEKSENQNKAEKSEDKESKNDEEDDKDISEAPVEEGEEISETTEEAEKSANEAADGTKSADETPEAESVEQDAGKTSNTSEKEEINAENGEISTEPESNNHKDDGESQLKDKNDLKAEEEGDEESKADGPADDESADIKEVAVESEEGAKKHDADEVDQAAGADEVERDAEGEKNDESTPSNSQPETAGTEMKAEPKLGDRKDSEEAEDQNGNKSDCDNENKETDLVKKETSTEKNTDEVTAGSSGNQEQSPVAVDLDVMASKLDEESKDTKSDVCPQTDENAVGGDVSAADGENGRDAEDASKASEEGASVLLKPQNNEADCTEETVATGRESPEALATEDSTDLVSNWVNKHQSSKFFETFVEPLEDMREEISDTPVSSSNKEETKSTELPRSGSPLKMATVSEDEVKVEEKAEVKDLMLKPKPEQSEEESAAVQKMRSEEHKGSTGSLQECNGQESAEKGINEETEVESTSGSRHSASEKPASVSKSQPDEKTIENNFNVTEPQTEEANQSTSPLGTEDVNETRGKADEQSREVTETTDFTTSKSDDGSPEDSRDEEIEGKASDRSVSRGGKDLQLIEDIKHTLSKDRLSAFSVDDTLFAHSSYPLLTAASAESGH
uniref:DUF4590 domain-containing protein n=1 Tax=Neolamprologus brichardi TaxID=32507 RepID=A0A3Q4H2P8_NEOBR